MSDHGSNVTPINKEAMAELIAMREQAAAHSAANAPVLTAEGYPAPPEMKVTRQQMKDARLPLNFRDYCAHILIPLNECRRETWFSPYKCTELRHAHEKCEYDEYMRRVEIARIKRKEAA